MALSLSLFPPEKVISLDVLQRACGFRDRSATKMAITELEERSIVSRMEDTDAASVVTVHGLMHEVLEDEQVHGAGEAKDEGGASAAVQYFEAFHLVRESARFDALRIAKENHGEELGDEEEIVLAAVKQNGGALKFCSERLRGEEKMMRAAMKSFGYHRVEGMLQFGDDVTEMVERILRGDLEEEEEKLGLDAPETLISVNNLGELLYAQGKLEEAEVLFRRALEGSERVLGVDHPDTLTSVNNLGTLLEAQGKLEEAEVLYRRALEGRERVLGVDHPGTLQSVNNLGMLLQKQGKLEEAEVLYRRALEGCERVLGVDHPSTLISVARGSRQAGGSRATVPTCSRGE